MSKVILVSKKINNSTWALAKGLRSQANDVVILTSRHEAPLEPIDNIEIMAYFKDWSFWEAVRLIPHLMSQKASIVHLLMEEVKVTGAYVVLSTFAQKNPNCVLSVSLFNSVKKISPKSPLKFLVEKSDIITLPTPDTLTSLRGLKISNRSQGRLVLAPVLPSLPSLADPAEIIEADFSQNESASRPKAMILFNQKRLRPDSDFFKSLSILAKKYQLVLYGSISRWPLRSRKKFSQWLSAQAAPQAPQWSFQPLENLSQDLRNASLDDILFLSFSDLSISRLAEIMVEGVSSRAAIFLDYDQTGIYAGLWRDGKNCWILRSAKNLKDLEEILHKKMTLPFPRPKELRNSQQLMDSSLNELNRLYNKALLQLR